MSDIIETEEDSTWECADDELAAFERFHAERVAEIEKAEFPSQEEENEIPSQEEMDKFLPLDEDGVFNGGAFFTWEEYRDILR